jgi:hypothetical protein
MIAGTFSRFLRSFTASALFQNHQRKNASQKKQKASPSCYRFFQQHAAAKRGLASAGFFSSVRNPLCFS